MTKDMKFKKNLTKIIPDKVSAMGTKGRLAQESGHELVPVNLVDAASHSSTSSVKALAFFELTGLFVAARTTSI